MPPKEKNTSQTFSFETVVVLVATIMEGGGSIGAKEFKRMSALDGTRGEHGFNHMFREVKTEAKKLIDQAKDAGELTPVKKTKGSGGASAKKDDPNCAGGKKRARKSKEEDADDAEEPAEKEVKAEAEADEDEDAPGEPNYEFEF